MTSILISGYFGLANGRRVSFENPTTHKTTHYVLYDSVVQTSGVDVPAEIRTWSPANEAVLTDGTVVDLLGKVHAAPNASVQIDILQMTVFPGDVTAANYEDNIPERPFPTLFVLGHTSGLAETMDDTMSVGYFVQASEYVRDQSRSSRIYCRFDGGKPRWKKTPRPQPGVPVFVVGVAHGLHLGSGSLQIDVDQVQLNVGGTTSSASTARVETGGAPVKRRKFPTVTASAASGVKKEGPGGPEQPVTEISGTVLPPPKEQPVEEQDAGTPEPRAGSRVRRAVKRKFIIDEAEEA